MGDVGDVSPSGKPAICRCSSMFIFRLVKIELEALATGSGIVTVIGAILLAFVKLVQKNGCLVNSSCVSCDCNEGRAATQDEK